jgi:MraZ protein
MPQCHSRFAFTRQSVYNCGDGWQAVGQRGDACHPIPGKAAPVFYGEFEHSIDDKGRITIPAKFRARLASGVVVTKGIDGCLLLFPTDAWDAIAAKLSEQPMTKSRVRELRRTLLAGASDGVPDKQGRVIIPPYLLEYARIQRQAIVIGQFDYCEIWNLEEWRQRQERADSDPEARAEVFESLDI